MELEDLLKMELEAGAEELTELVDAAEALSVDAEALPPTELDAGATGILVAELVALRVDNTDEKLSAALEAGSESRD
jgi:hypothetical protein